MNKSINRRKNKNRHLFLLSILFFLGFMANEVVGDVVGLNAISKVLLLAFMLMSALMVLQRGIRIPSTLILLLSVNLFWWFLTVFWTPGHTALISTLAQNLLLCFCVYIFFYYYKDYDLLYQAMYFAGILLMLYSISVYGISGFFSALQANERMGYGVTNANTFGRVFAYSILAGLYFVLYKKKWWYGLGCLLFLIFALSSGSKKSILIILIGATVLLFYRYGARYTFRFLLGMIVVFAVMYFVIRLPIFKTAYNRFSLFMSGQQDYSDSVRSRMISVGWDMIRQKPFFGWGLNAYAAVSGFNVYSHNNYIEMLVNFGLLGFSLYYYMYVHILMKLIRHLKPAFPQHVMMFTIIIVILITDYGIVSYALKWSWIIIGAAASMRNSLKSVS